jgi:uroporphyrinogen decarboxylase
MRQAGRALPEYRKLRGHESILEAISQPELAAELTMQPVRRYGVDAAILYSDIMVPVFASGFGVDVKPGVGPVVDTPFQNEGDLSRLSNFSTEENAPYVIETVQLLVKELDVPLIGFTGAPFTVASYLIEGEPTRTWLKTKALMHTNTALWNSLCSRLSDMAIDFLSAQLDAGASTIQLFDSWVGCLSANDFREFVKPHIDRIIREIQKQHDRPIIYFGTDTAHLLSEIKDLPADVIGVDWRLPLDQAWELLGKTKGVQGNLDPAICVSGFEAAVSETRDILIRAKRHDGHIFNLGHGVLPETDPSVLEQIVAVVHEETRR